jgi:hypothetical protein
MVVSTTGDFVLCFFYNRHYNLSVFPKQMGPVYVKGFE